MEIPGLKSICLESIPPLNAPRCASHEPIEWGIAILAIAVIPAKYLDVFATEACLLLQRECRVHRCLMNTAGG